MWVIFIFCVVSVIFDLLLTYSTRAVQHRFLIWNLFLLFEYGFLIYFYYLIINQRFIRILILIFSFFYLIFFILYFTSNSNKFNTVLSAVESVTILLLSLSYFLILLRPTTEPVNIFNSVFLIVVGLLLYVSSTLFLYILVNSLTEKEMGKYWSINSYGNILVSIIFSIAFSLVRFERKNIPPENHYVDFTSPEDR
jgi:hypothetical protein